MGTYNQLSSEMIFPKEAHDVVVIMVPYPCQSHLNQLLHLSCLISSYKIPVHYACLATHVQQARARFNDTTSPEFSKINFHELTTEFTSLFSNRNSVSKFSINIPYATESFLRLRQLMVDLIKEISRTTRRVIVIHDIFMCYTVQDGATLPNVELYVFNPISAFTFYCNGREMDAGYSPDEMPEGLPSSEGCIPPEIVEFFSQMSCLDLSVGVIFNSCRPIEGTYIDLTGTSGLTKNKPRWAIGPLNIGTTFEKKHLNTRHGCLKWLDKQIPNSVIYVSFGTSTSMSKQAIKEIALGLEQSEQKFIWICRHADKGNIFASDEEKVVELPQGFEERTEKSGIIVRDWAPQLEILEHPSTGGFLSHCGWNSCLESITMGVPMVAWPMNSDQPRNAYLITDVLKVGVIVRNWEQRDELVTSSTIAKAIRTLMSSREGDEMRRRAEELGNLAREALKDGGVSRIELNSFIAHITSQAQ